MLTVRKNTGPRRFLPAC